VSFSAWTTWPKVGVESEWGDVKNGAVDGGGLQDAGRHLLQLLPCVHGANNRRHQEQQKQDGRTGSGRQDWVLVPENG